MNESLNQGTRPKTFNILDCDISCDHRTNLLAYLQTTHLHNHDGYEILLFLGGTANFFVESEAKRLERGDILLMAPYAFHCADTSRSEKYDRIVLNIRESFMNNQCSQKTDLRTCFTATPPNMLNNLHLNEDEIAEFMSLAEKIQDNLHHPGYASELMISSLFVQLMVMLNKKSITAPTIEFQNTMPKIVSETIHYINTNLQNQINMRTLSDYLHHDPDYICRCFKKVTGSNVQQFIIAKRISLAQKYLREGTSIGESCLLSGFSDFSNFSRSFSKHIGMSPKQYQRQVMLN